VSTFLKNCLGRDPPEWVDWFKNRRLSVSPSAGPVGNIPPAGAESNFCAQFVEARLPRSTQTNQPPANPARFNQMESQTSDTARLFSGQALKLPLLTSKAVGMQQQ